MATDAPAGASTANGWQDVSGLWQQYLKQAQELSQPWLRLMTRDAPTHIGRSLPGDHTELLELSKHYWDAYERTIGRLLGSPSLGYSRELNHLLGEGFDAWQEFVRAGFEYRIVIGDAWTNAFKRSMAKLSELGEQGKPITSMKDLIEVWTDIGDEAFTEVFESKRYIDAQARILNASMALRHKQQEIVDDLLKGSFVPSRAEVDEAHQGLYELRKEVRDLKKQLATMRASQRVASRRTSPAARRRT